LAIDVAAPPRGDDAQDAEAAPPASSPTNEAAGRKTPPANKRKPQTPTITEMSRRSSMTDEERVFDVFTGEMVSKKKKY